jgi:TatD DNase family protein
MILIDTHCHLYSEEFDADLKLVVDRAHRNGIVKIFLPAIDSHSHEKLIALSKKADVINHSPLTIYPMMGLHPCSVKENFEVELKLVEQYLNSSEKFYAVGEIGLDYHWDLTFKEQQIIAFERQIEWAIARKLPIVIHSRKSTYDCIGSLKKFNGAAKGIFHCFSGSFEEANEIIKLGFYLGIGGVVTYKNSGLKELLPLIGLHRIVLETDAPYLSPVPHRGKRNEPAYVKLVCEDIARIMGVSYREVADITTQNAQRVFQLI